jgi:hypothetical protein
MRRDNVCRAWQSRPMAAAQDQYEQLLNITGCFDAPPDSVSESATASSNESQDPTPAMRNITAERRCLQSLDLSVLLKHADHAGSYSDSLDSSRYAPVIDGTELQATPLYPLYSTTFRLLASFSYQRMIDFHMHSGDEPRAQLTADQRVERYQVYVGGWARCCDRTSLDGLQREYDRDAIDMADRSPVVVASQR